MKTTRVGSMVLITLSALAVESLAAEVQLPVDISAWKCRTCPVDEGWSGVAEFGLGYVSDDSFKFGEYTGLNEDGGYLIGGADVRYRRNDGYFLDIIARDVGLDSRLLEARTGVQGRYQLSLQYDELPHFISDSARTPFRGVGTNTLTLPPGWVRAGNTAGMTALPASVSNVELATERTRIGIGAAFVAGSNWEYALNVRHETKEGMKRIAGAFFFNAAQLIEPVDYVTDEINASASYTGSRLQARFAYYGSLFRNGNDSLTWANPYTSVFVGADSGRLALAPDNQFHQLLAAAGYQLTPATRATAELALGRMTQDESFLPATVNPSLVVPALPRPSLEGRVDTLTAKLAISNRTTERLQLNASYTHNDRDNKTPQAAYAWVTTDSVLNPAARTNLPYSFTRDTLKLSGDYRIDARLKGSGGFDHDTHERTFQEVEETRENTVWGKLNARAWRGADVLLRVARADRNVSNYAPVPATTPPQNPLLRKYNMADRQRDTAGVQLSLPATEAVTVGAGIDYARDDYSGSAIGLTDARELGLSADAAIVLGKRTSLHFFLTQQQIESNQAGSQVFSTPDWRASNDDTITTAGLGVKHVAIENKLDIGADLTTSRSRGEITVTSGLSTPFPDLRSTLRSFKLYANYRLQERWTLYAAYWYERYDSDDWALDGVTPSTVANLLGLGETSPDYSLSFVTLTARYKF